MNEKESSLRVVKKSLIQTSNERSFNALLEKVEKDLLFYKTTLLKSGSFYEGTEVGKPDDFDYFVQLDNFCQSKDIRFEQEPIKFDRLLLRGISTRYGGSDSKRIGFRITLKSKWYPFFFSTGKNIKSPFVEALHSQGRSQPIDL